MTGIEPGDPARAGDAAGDAADDGLGLTGAGEDWDAEYAATPAQVLADDEPQLLYPDARSWVDEHLSQLVRRQLGAGSTWCAQWWRHAEAISRLEALWRAWEILRLEPTLGMSVWWLHHADPHLAVLLSRDSGPFSACTPDRHVELDLLPTVEAPPDHWGVPEGSGRPT